MGLTLSHHCAYDAHYHVVFPVKYRKALLSSEIAKEIQEISRGIEERYEIKFEQMGTDGDHIHILCSFHPKMGGADFVRIFKSITARKLFLKFPELKKDLWGGEFWTDGYYIATVSEKGNWQVVQRYVENQGKTTGKKHQLKIWN